MQVLVIQYLKKKSLSSVIKLQENSVKKFVLITSHPLNATILLDEAILISKYYKMFLLFKVCRQNF